MRILVTNDDGVEAPGIAALVEVARQFGDVTVVAPTEGVSSCGHHVTTHRDLQVCEVRPGWFSVDGYPADCVRVALTMLIPEVDLVFSGINDGGNLGIDLLMSGTASAAREAALWGRRAVAMSQYKARRGDVDWSRSIGWARQALSALLTREATPNTFWNVNLPDPPPSTLNPPIVKCEIDDLPLSIAYTLQGKTWKYASGYQVRPRTQGKDVDNCFSGAITISEAPVFFP